MCGSGWNKSYFTNYSIVHMRRNSSVSENSNMEGMDRGGACQKKVSIGGEDGESGVLCWWNDIEQH